MRRNVSRILPVKALSLLKNIPDWRGQHAPEYPSFNLVDFIADKLLLSSAYVLFKPAADYTKFYGESHQLFLTTLPSF